jgi:hypothetical protein
MPRNVLNLFLLIYCLVDNQRIHDAKVAGIISLDLKPDRCVSNPPKLIVI